MFFLEEKDSGNLVLCVELECSKCGINDYKDFKPKGISFGDYIHESIKLVCPKCGTKFKAEPIFGVKTSFFDDGNGSRQPKSKSSKKKEIDEKLPEVYLQKYSDNFIIAESILIGNIPYFLVSKKGTKTIEILREKDVGNKMLKPLELTSYINRPYFYTSKEEIEQYIETAKNLTLDIIYNRVKSIWKKYIDADDFHISICSADTIFTYFQDIIGLTHYLFFVGNNGSGKSNNLKVFNLLAYRNMLSTDITPANIYQFLGSQDEGIGTICEDEADGIDEDRVKMSIYKNGYTTGFPVFRLLELNNGNGSGRKQTRLNTFCFKAFAAERLPDSTKAKGFNERVLQIHCTYGSPKHDITEVVNPAGEDEFQKLLNELNQIRNTLLIYRLLHYNDGFPDIPVNLQNREKQLFKPLIRIFQNTETLKELLPIIGKFVGNKRKANANTLHAFIYRSIMSVIKCNDSCEIESKEIWEFIIENLQGEHVTGKTMTFDSSDFGQISQKKITEICMEIFGAEKSKRHGKSRSLIFNLDKLEKMGKSYDLSPDVNITNEDENGTHGTHGTYVGLDKHFNETESSEESDDSTDKISNNYEEIDKKDIENTKQESDNTGQSPKDVSQASQASQIEMEKPAEEPEKCPNCDKMIDPFDTNTHPACCSGRKEGV